MNKMNLSKILLAAGFMLFLQLKASAQSGDIVGSWQLVKQSTCLEQAANGIQEGPDDVSASGRIVTFKDNASAEESAPVLNSSKSSNSKKFFYKFNGEMLLILDKKSQVISDSYMVDKFSKDSLIVSNSARPCETHIFVKIKGEQPN